ncbi:3-hydroxyacyl-CoA dehydrogenase family protein [Streptomyces acidiscabies]|uniref:3-hydroxybutyryl-CoA dehydrogenase n=3 Tax=Streptomyces acidiscabies TaxID=42234 RepID=A0AAP6EGM4_9ACTN|nr:3-hydroxyacyl-CoA dehydrogenase [Streptomyces acidiscabies]MBP5935872.1 3-hydroxyacyl-CoA dehydrogenase family protein [Streptomyces sp. LBUM 1476]MBZ3916207.1 NAD(P)-binding domain-containing protein [Streptomyces acidiscabies]MDX2962118.1 3-hydroxybutyryl-CoA dehydrogenase [Streptomyces acidiscabies]MDX3017885.1 3-hydroxybutyryl-CoA dehydrogenase [Streptomyces acidiscabies]MDX3791342.1 3-hydroxybutyryl-CoA dehydrogenase [Streptomyces acidiscabies]
MATPLSLSSQQTLRTVAVVGLGTMGTGIAEVLAKAGRRVIGIDISAAQAARCVAALETSTARAVARGRLTEQQRADALALVRTGTDLREAADADLVIEVAPESYEIKQQIFRELDGVVRPDTILATGTNALSVTRLAAESARPERVLGLHFFNPAPAMKLVEVVSSVLTAPQAVATVTELAVELGKEPVAVGDRPGFVADGLLFGYLNQAAAMYEARYASREDIDAAMRLGCGLPMGPLALLDLIGVDTARTVLDALYAASHDRLHAPAPILRQLSAAGLTGRKAGRGFYTYEAPGSATVVPDALTPVPGASGVPGRPVRSVGVAGSGTMASGIAEVFAKAGYDVVLAARSEEKALAAKARIGTSLARSVDKGRLTAESAALTLGRITPAGSYEAFADVDLAVEAVAEDLAVKQQLFATLDKVCRPGAVLATTTSSLPVIACARATSRPQDVVGMHFFNPAPAMKLVEVVRTVLTADDTRSTVDEVCASIKKHPVNCGDRAGFIVNALLFPYLNNAIKMVQEHYASLDDIDAAMRLGGGYPMGPFELLDVVGLDVSLAIEKVLHREFRDPGLAPAPLLEHLVAAGCLGRKTGRGFREHARR